jgi:hypothetical protein
LCATKSSRFLVVCQFPRIQLHRNWRHRSRATQLEHAARLLNMLTENTDLGGTVYFKLRIELDRLSAPGELHLNDLIVLG